MRNGQVIAKALELSQLSTPQLTEKLGAKDALTRAAARRVLKVRSVHGDLPTELPPYRAPDDRRPRYKILSDCGPTYKGEWFPLVIRDVGPWEQFLTVTNGAVLVVEELFEAGKLPNGRRLFYYDSSDRLDELLIKDSLFAGFAPLPGRVSLRPCGGTSDARPGDQRRGPREEGPCGILHYHPSGLCSIHRRKEFGHE